MNLRRIGLLALTVSLVLLPASIAVGGATPANAATPGTYTGWTLNLATGCSTRAQVPYLDQYQQVVAYPQVYCPRPTGLTVRSRVRSVRTFTDVTVAQWGCTGSTSCAIYLGAGITRFPSICPQTRTRVTHGYHSDIVIYLGVQSFSLTGSTSGNVTLSPYCKA